MLLTSLALADSFSLTYADALELAARRNVGVLGAGQAVLRADGALIAARSLFAATVTTTGGYAQGQQQELGLFGDSYSEWSGWNARVALSQPLVTGTTFDVSFEEASSRFYSRSVVDTFEIESEGVTFEPKLSLGLSQALLQGFRLASNLSTVRAAQNAKSVAEAQRQAAYQRALAAAASAYWQLYYTRRSLEIANATVELQREQGRIVRALVDNGRLAPVEATRSAAAVAQAERAALDAGNAASAAQDALLGVVGELGGQEVALLTTPGDPPALNLDDAAVVQAVLQANPDLLAARIRVDGARQALADARHALLPLLAATGTVDVSGSDADHATAWQEFGQGALLGWSVGGQLTLPLGNRADRGSLSQAQADLGQAEIDLSALEVSLTQEARTQVRLITGARRAVDLALLNASLAQETLQVEQARLQEGKALQKDVIAAVNDLARAQVELEKARIDFQGAVVELERLKGSL